MDYATPTGQEKKLKHTTKKSRGCHSTAGPEGKAGSYPADGESSSNTPQNFAKKKKGPEIKKARLPASQTYPLAVDLHGRSSASSFFCVVIFPDARCA